jgi:type I restriction enzyme R subunit
MNILKVKNGTELNALLPKMSPLNPVFDKKTKGISKLTLFIEKFKGVGGQL